MFDCLVVPSQRDWLLDRLSSTREISLVDWQHLVSKDLLCRLQSHSMGENPFVMGQLFHVHAGHFCTVDIPYKVSVLPLWHFEAWGCKMSWTLCQPSGCAQCD
jgi:hypothetical protein